ncbi:MAG: iron ABC transporter permease [Bacillota bacterium]|nr:iron ABC transporter permease [Bacillota bacterium]
MEKSRKSYLLTVTAFLLLLLGVAVFMSISFGSTRIALSDIVTALKEGDQTSTVYRTIQYVRIPRTLAAILAGAALSVAGVILQSVLNNSLAGPNIIGINSGAGLFAILAAVFFPMSFYLKTVAAFTGAIVTTLLVYLVAKKTGASRVTIILSGVAVGSFIGAMIDTIIILKPDAVVDRAAFLIGGFSAVTLDRLKFAGVLIVLTFIISLIRSYDMNVLALGDDSASSLGMNVGVFRFFYLVLAAVLVGSSISFTGILGFVGLIVPHTSRLLVGHDNRILLPVSALLGSIFTLSCDLLARVIFAPYELPVGIIMSFLGGPFFIWLLARGNRGQLYD